MAGFFAQKHRSVVPRWRLFTSTVAMGELSSESSQRLSPPVSPNHQVLDWQTSRTVWHATDLLSAAVVSKHHESAKDAARFLLARWDEVTPAALALADAILHPNERAEQSEFEGDWRALTRALRSSVKRDARSAMQWADLALAHTVLGNRDNAIRAMTVAISLAPDNRFILRSGARCFLHWGEADRAHVLLRSSGATLSDPWVLSAEIAISSARQRPSRNVAAARSLVKSGAFSPYDTSELACGLGSLEFEAGSRRHAIPMLARAMERPTENAVAQVEWVFNKDKKPPPALDDIHVERLYEAEAVEHFVKGEWQGVVSYAERWLEDQPFSSRPADLAAYAESLLGHYSRAVSLLSNARASNPDDQMILNNLAYYSALAGELPQAKRWLAMVDWNKVDDVYRPVFLATTGLLAFRSGDPESGREAYAHAVKSGIQRKDARLEALALLNLAREEWMAGQTEGADATLREARVAARRAQGEDIKCMLHGVATEIESRHPATT